VTIRVGLQLPVQAQSTAMAMPWEADGDLENIVAVARAADAAGFSHVAVCDHTAISREASEKMRTEWWEPFTLLAFLAASTEQVRLLTHVHVPAVTHPLITAKHLATLDRVSGGRAILGVGAGHLQAEFEALDADFEHRGSITDEAIDVIRAAMRDEWVTHHGEFFTIDDMAISPRPVQASVPIWVGGSSAPARRRAAERGDGWLPQGTRRADMPAMLDHIRSHREAVGNEDQIELGATHEPMYLGGQDLPLPSSVMQGSPDELVASFRGLEELGCSHAMAFFVSMSASDLVEQVQRFGDEVLRQL
jgi:probable F420-dependent oxidoreductase